MYPDPRFSREDNEHHGPGLLRNIKIRHYHKGMGLHASRGNALLRAFNLRAEQTFVNILPRACKRGNWLLSIEVLLSDESGSSHTQCISQL